ncbi:MAG: tetratricopeptide repeat protein [Helicobacteraceae bacterium]|nr:tetratricopeptide repeat protein [Helicobacteraceae bacterium]
MPKCSQHSTAQHSTAHLAEPSRRHFFLTARKFAFLIAITALFFISPPSQIAADNSSAFNKGVEAVEAEDYHTAVSEFTKAIKIDPNSAGAYGGRGLAYRELGDYNKAIADCAKAIKIDPNNAFAYINRGVSYADLGDYNKAIADYTKAIKINPKYALAYYGRGFAYGRLRDYEKATKDARKACELGDCRLFNKMKENNLLRD